MRINLPNALTLFRIALLPVMVAVFYLHEVFPGVPLRAANAAAAGVFVLASVTDWLDGWLARRFNQASAFSEFLDPVADKLMVAVTLFVLVQSHPTVLLAITAAVIVGREIAVSALREWMAFIGERARVRVQWVGKVKTVMQIVALVVLLLEHDAPKARVVDVYHIREALDAYHIGEALLVIAAILTIWSGLAYLRAAWPALRMDAPRAGSDSSA